MEYKVQNRYTATLGYRWYFATYRELVVDKATVLREFDDEDQCCGDVKSIVVNDEIRGYYHINRHEDDLCVNYCVELFGQSNLTCSIPIYTVSQSWDNITDAFREEPENVKVKIFEFCLKTHFLCKCGGKAIERLGNRCETCFLYNFKRKDDDRCAICLEDEGRWIQLSCLHVIHQHCWDSNNTNSSNGFLMKCPICRTRVQPKKCYKNYPYSVPTSVMNSA